MGAIGLLNNEPGSQFRGGCDALGPEVALCLTYLEKEQKRNISQKTHFYYQNDAKLGTICSHARKTFFKSDPGV